MNNKKMILVAWALPFVAAVLAVLLCCIALASPFLAVWLSLESYNNYRTDKDKIQKKYELIKSGKRW